MTSRNSREQGELHSNAYKLSVKLQNGFILQYVSNNSRKLKLLL